MSVPPHLPPPVCNIKAHRNWQRLKILLAAAVFGLVAGLAGASVMLGWIWPGFGGGDTWIISQQNRTALNRVQLEDRVRAEISDRIVGVYSQLDGNASNVGYVRADNKIGDAIILSSDGWLAMYHKGGVGSYKKWKVMASDGALYDLEKALFDDRTDILFLKISLQKESDRQRSGGQFKVVGFSDKVSVLDEVYVYENNIWQYTWINSVVPGALGTPHVDTAPAWAYMLRYDFAPGSVVVNSQGRIVGIVVDGGYLLPYQFVTRPMAQVLGQQKIVYPTLGVEGWYDFEWPMVVNNERQVGFYVSRLVDKKSILRVGDIIVEIDGKLIGSAVGTSEDLWYNLDGKNNTRLKILRAGKSLEITANIIN